MIYSSVFTGGRWTESRHESMRGHGRITPPDSVIFTPVSTGGDGNEPIIMMKAASRGMLSFSSHSMVFDFSSSKRPHSIYQAPSLLGLEVLLSLFLNMESPGCSSHYGWYLVPAARVWLLFDEAPDSN